jgi:selenocysteine-specific translation elongation factor
VRLHLGTADVGARVVARGGPVRPGAVVPVRLVLDQPLVARGGDRFVLRAASPATTIGGGVITDPAPPFRRTPPFASASASAEQRLRWMIEEEAGRGLAVAAAPMRLGSAEARGRSSVRVGRVVRSVSWWSVTGSMSPRKRW